MKLSLREQLAGSGGGRAGQHRAGLPGYQQEFQSLLFRDGSLTMFKILRKTAQTGLVTIGYPEKPALLSMRYRGAPRFDFSHWRDSRPAAEVCPTGAISIEERDDTRLVTVDYGLCIYCGQCAEADTSGAVKVTREFELAVRDRRNLVVTGEYAVDAEGVQSELKKLHPGFWAVDETSQELARTANQRIHHVRSE